MKYPETIHSIEFVLQMLQETMAGKTPSNEQLEQAIAELEFVLRNECAEG